MGSAANRRISTRGRNSEVAASDHCWAQEIFQTSTMGALLDGVYEGNVTVRELLRHGAVLLYTS
ncbi:acetolactate decarboxylase, partial [Mycobacterium avium]|uniref:acetolactate decarboxylase n=1 Tax=Mycobacterium avium TaxID=1764 RepID=UPI002F26D608